MSMHEPIWLFSQTDNSIDLVGALIFAWAAVKSIKYLYLNHITPLGKSIYLLIGLISILHVIQVAIQFIAGGPVDGVTFRAWDFINYLTAVLFLIAAERIHRKETPHNVTVNH